MNNYANSTDYAMYLSGRAAVITTAFDFYARCVTQIIKLYTGSNVDEGNISDEVKNCCCELAEVFYRQDMSVSNNGVSSESVGGWSKSFESSVDKQNTMYKTTHDIIYKWLASTGLLYRGV